MIIDFNAEAPGERHGGYHACIAGGGVAGIILARHLAGRGRRVLLLEAGGLDITAESQDLYRGENIGRPYFDLATARLRFLGGTSNHWRGWCRPLDPWDFERHEHIPHSGWPIGKAALDPYLAAACEMFEVSPDYQDRAIADSEGSFSFADFKLSKGPVLFGEKYRRFLETSESVDVFLNANLVDARMTGSRVTEFVCANYGEPARRHAFSAETFVLAMGGIENARMLLNFTSHNPSGIGNDRGLVGRFFMDHFHASGGYYAAERETWPFATDGAVVRITATPALMTREKIGNIHIRLGPMYVPQNILARLRQGIVCAEDAVRDFVRKFHPVQCPVNVYAGGWIHLVSEPAPNPHSRVVLTDETDRFGLKRVALDWRTVDLDRRTLERSMMVLGEYLARRRYGNVKLVDWLLDKAAAVPGVGEDDWLGAGWHHIGTTRMAATPSEGVVDENCRVFGTDNLYVAGSSVFPTCGHANPTLTIGQLALRLGDHIAGPP